MRTASWPPTEATEAVSVLALEPSKAWLTLVPEVLKVAPRNWTPFATRAMARSSSADMRHASTVGPSAMRIPLTSPVLRASGSGTWVYRSSGHVRGSRSRPGRLRRGEATTIPAKRGR